MNPLKTPLEVSELLGVSEWWVRDQARNKKVPHQRFGKNKIMFTEEQVEHLVGLHTVKADNPVNLAEEVTQLLSRSSPKRRRARSA